MLVLHGYFVILFSKFTTTEIGGSVPFLIYQLLSYIPTVAVTFEVMSHSRALIKLPDTSFWMLMSSPAYNFCH